MTSICSGLVVQVVSALLRGNWQDFNWHDASHGWSAIAELLVSCQRKILVNFNLDCDPFDSLRQSSRLLQLMKSKGNRLITAFYNGLRYMKLDKESHSHYKQFYNVTHTHTHTRLTALYPGLSERVPERWNQSVFYWSNRQWVAVESAGPYASLHVAPDR